MKLYFSSFVTQFKQIKIGSVEQTIDLSFGEKNVNKMWAPKKENTPQVYPPLYGQTPGALAGQQIPQPSLQQPFQHSLTHYPQMSSHMGQPLGAGMGQGLGPPPPYSPYAEPSQQQMKYMPQMAYNPNQYMANHSVGAPVVPQQHQTSVASPQHSYPNPYQTNPYQNSGLYQYNPYQNLPPNSTVVIPHAFDAGARFDGIARPTVPPPPPGVAPNAAQMAAMQGQNVVLNQKKGSFLEGGSSGGYTFW